MYGTSKDKKICVPWQLFTDIEIDKYGFNRAYFRAVSMSSKDTIMFNGMRFGSEDFKELGIIEIDADGVILAIHTHINNYVQSLYNGFDGDTHITSWGMRELDALNPQLRPKLYSLFGDPKFMSSVPAFNNAIEALDIIMHSCCYSTKLIPIINTHCFTPEIGRARKTSLKKLLYDNGLPIPVIVSVGKDKEMMKHNVFMCIEDNAENLRKSDAFIKCLVARGHNRFETKETIKGTTGQCVCFVGSQLRDYAEYLKTSVHLTKGSYHNAKKVFTGEVNR